MPGIVLGAKDIGLDGRPKSCSHGRIQLQGGDKQIKTKWLWQIVLSALERSKAEEGIGTAGLALSLDVQFKIE